MFEKSHIFIDLSESDVKVVSFSRTQDRVLLKRCDVIALAGRPAADVDRDFRPLASRVRNADVVLSLPRKKVILKSMRLPSSDPAEIAQMIGLQLVNQIPYSLQEVVYDHVIVRKDDTGYTHVQVIVVLVSVIEEYLKLLGPVSAAVQRMSVSSCELAAWFEQLARRRNWPSTHVYMVLNLDRDSSEICFCQGGQMLLSRAIPAGLNDISRRETAGIFQQIAWSLEMYQKECVGSQVHHAVIVGVGDDLESFRLALEEKAKMTVDLARPLEAFDDKMRKSFDLMAARPDASWTVSLGYLSHPSRHQLNLSPKTLRQGYASQKRLRRRVVTVALAALLLISVGILAGIEVTFRQSRLTEIERRLTEAGPKAEQLKLITEHTRALDDYFRRRVHVADVMKEIYKRTPEDVIYQSIYWTEEGEWIFQGYAQTRSGVNNLQSGMIDSAWFKDVQLDYATQRKLGNVDVTDFRIHCRLADKARGER